MPEKLSNIFNLIIIFSMIIWGGSWVSAKAIAGTYDAYVLTFLRFFVSTLSFLPILIFMKLPLFVDKKTLRYIFFGSVSMGLYFYFFFKGLEKGLASVAGVFVTSLIPVFTLMLSKLFFRRSFRTIDYLGIIVGFIGGIVIIKGWKLRADNIFMSGNIYFLLCPTLWAFVTIFSEKSGEKISPIIFSFYCYLFCSLFFLFLSIDKQITSVIYGGVKLWVNIFYLSIISSTIATTAYFYSTTKISSYKASSYAFIVPVSSLILSMLFLKESPELTTVLGGLLSTLATVLINYH